MGLVSSLYRMAPTDTYPDKDESERRLKVFVQRLVGQHGQAEVIRRIRAWPIAKDQEGMAAWIILTVWASKERARAGTI